MWRAFDSKGDILDILVQSRRNKQAATRFFRKLFKSVSPLRTIVTDKPRDYEAARKKPRSENRAPQPHGPQQ
ncbi:MAG: DDE-type integrase/transposase/recombinase [Sedimentitalea sp.]|uniref:DDE-type integrase/transposase/recombinase n=1 Tax=Sedimentitalea sp. TaxID=2048915 RepID=UPI00326705F1